MWNALNSPKSKKKYSEDVRLSEHVEYREIVASTNEFLKRKKVARVYLKLQFTVRDRRILFIYILIIKTKIKQALVVKSCF